MNVKTGRYVASPSEEAARSSSTIVPGAWEAPTAKAAVRDNQIIPAIMTTPPMQIESPPIRRMGSRL